MEELKKTIEVSQKYLDEHTDLSSSNTKDYTLLNQAITCGEIILSSPSWRTFSEMHEMGVWVDHFPQQCGAWSLLPSYEESPLLMGLTQLCKAQTWVDQNLSKNTQEMVHLFSSLGERTMNRMRIETQRLHGESTKAEDSQQEPPRLQNGRINKSKHKKSRPKSVRSTEPKLTEARTVSKAKAVPNLSMRKDLKSGNKPDNVVTEAPQAVLRSALKVATTSVRLLEPSSELYHTKLRGTSSSKLSYLLDRITELHQQEKIIIFYDGDQIGK